jgi:hypothetical protein
MFKQRSQVAKKKNKYKKENKMKKKNQNVKIQRHHLDLSERIIHGKFNSW